MRIADCISILNLVSEVPKDLTLCRQAVSDSTELGISDFTAKDWAFKIGDKVIDTEEDAVIELCGFCLHGEKLTSEKYREFIENIRWRSFPEGINAGGVKAVFTQSMRVLPVLMSFYYKDNKFNFIMEKK